MEKQRNVISNLPVKHTQMFHFLLIWGNANVFRQKAKLIRFGVQLNGDTNFQR